MSNEPRKPVNFDQLYPGRFLKAGSFEGRKVALTIKDVNVEELEGETGPKKKATIAFVETDMQLVACKTNGLCIKAMFGAELSNWIGKKVTLFPSLWNGEDCIRVWGSPDIPRDLSVEVKLPRRKPFSMLMHKMPGKGEAAPPPAAPPPASTLHPEDQALAEEFGRHLG